VTILALLAVSVHHAQVQAVHTVALAHQATTVAAIHSVETLAHQVDSVVHHVQVAVMVAAVHSVVVVLPEDLAVAHLTQVQVALAVVEAHAHLVDSVVAEAHHIQAPADLAAEGNIKTIKHTSKADFQVKQY
jgi:hypothetical protein